MRQTYALMFALIVTAAFTSGCRSENYYCDAEGCFLCDGLGCRPVDPPPRPDCNGDYECPEGSVCTDIGCVTECDGDSDCPQGTECREGQCLNPTEPEPEPNPGTCTRSSDCPAGENLICVDGVCQVDNTCGATGACECSATEPCAAGFTCVDGTCRADSATCQFNHECGTGRICVNGECREGCEDSSTCPAGQTCESNVCVDLPPVPECTNNTECGAGEICVDAECVTGCTNDTMCGAEEYCLGGICVYDDRPQPFCSSNADCQPGRPCVGGVCRTPCETSMECLSFDVQFRVCQNLFCVTNNEATSNCELSQDCSTAGDTCIDGVCR